MVAVHTDTAGTADSSGTSDAAKPRVAGGLWLTPAPFPAVELAVGCAPVTLVAAHLANTTIYDLLAWSAITALTLAAVLHNRPRLWLAVGAVTGISLENKDLPLLLVIALLAGLVATGRWRVLRTPWLPAGAALALALWAPNLAWQATHGWPALTMSRILSAEHSGFGDYLTV